MTSFAALRKHLLRAVRGGWLVYLGAAVLSRLGGMVLVPLYTRRLSTEEYGSYSLVVSLTAVLPLMLTLGLTAVVSKVFFDEPTLETARTKVGTVARWMYLLAAGAGAIIAILGALAWPNGALTLSGKHVALAVVGSVGTAFSTVPEGYFRATRQATRVVALQLFLFFSTTGLGLLFVAVLGRGLNGAIEATAIVGGCVGAFSLVFVSRLGGEFEPGTLRRWLPVSLPFVLHFFASWLLTMGDRWVLSARNLGAELGTYYLAVQLVSPALMLVTTWNEIEAARLGEVYRDRGIRGARAVAFRRTLVYFLIAMVGAAGVLMLIPLLPYVVGQRFVGSSSYLPALLLAHLLESQYFVPGLVLLYAGRTGVFPSVTVLSGLMNVTLAWVLVPRFGVPGLLVARVLASFTRSALMAAAAFGLAREPTGDQLTEQA